jgi:polyferredoxin
MMKNVGLPQGLIRLDSENGIANKQPWRFTKRIMAYTAVLCVLIGVLIVLLVTRKDIDATVMRTPGMLYQQDSGYISNLYNIKLINKTHHDIPVQVKLESAEGIIRVVGKELTVNAASEAAGTFFIVLPQSAAGQRKTTLKLALYAGERKIKSISTSFLGPGKKRRNEK